VRQYFFDYVSENESLRDYRGRQFMADSLAREYAELIAIHLQHDPQGAYFAWSIVVRDVKGAELFSVPVPAPEDDQPGVFRATVAAAEVQPLVQINRRG
jgi:hypothetical protein